MLILGNYIRSLRLLLILHRLVLTLAENIEDQLIFDDKQYFENDAAVNSTEEENCEPPISIDIAEIVKNVTESTLSIQDQASTDTNLNKDSSDACISEIIDRCCDHMEGTKSTSTLLYSHMSSK